MSVKRGVARKTILGPATVLLVALVLAPLAWPSPARASTGYYTVTNGTGGKMAGAALQNLSTDSVSDVATAVARIKADGMNTLDLDVWWEADSASANSLHTYTDTVPDDVLSEEIAVAEDAGLSVSLTPLFYCSGCLGGFRGVIQPSDPSAFFASYAAFIDHYAALAQAGGVGTFFVGSEMTTLEPYTQDWLSVIAGVRNLFKGRISYEENWDVLGQAHFLGAVDDIGVSAYFPLDGGASPGLAQLLADWRSSSMAGWKGRNWVQEVAALATRYHKPIVFGEVGYMSGDYAGAQPYLNYYSIPNLGLQADLYQALLETFQPYGWWAGVVWWYWSAEPDAPADNGRSFTGKGAEVLLSCWYADGMRPDNPATALP